MNVKTLKGITWGHTRGLLPVQAVSQRFSELHPDVEIVWQKRSLQEFADFPIEKLTQSFDLLVIDHPWVGTAAATNCVLPLEKYLDPDYLQNQLQHSVGQSHQSYQYAGSQWALAIDAAAPAASYRPDLMQKATVPIPEFWEDVLALARKGKIAVPAIPIDLLMNFYSFSIALGEEPFSTEERIVSSEKGMEVLECMRALYSLIDPRFFKCNPIAVAEIMTREDDYWYCPFAYCYSNYSRLGYARNLLNYTKVVQVQGSRLKTTLGGTGLAVSATSMHLELAIEFARMSASSEIQSGIYAYSGGQPGHGWAWEDAGLNFHTHGFFNELRPLMEDSYMRPRYHGYLHFQDHAGQPLQDYLMGKTTASSALQSMNRCYTDSIQIKNRLHGQ